MRTLLAIAAIGGFVFAASIGAFAQTVTPPMPASAYAPDQVAAAVPMPDSDPGGDGSVVTVPIPLGGSVRVEGPALPVNNWPPPIETWAGQQQTPNTVVPSPIGPKP